MPSRHIHRAITLAALAGLAAATTMCLGGHAARADNILAFGQINLANSVRAFANSAGTQTLIDIDAVPITITQLLGSGAPVDTLLTLDAASKGPATPLGAGGFQTFSGSFSIGNGPINYLSGTFSDIVLGGGASAVLSSGEPPDAITFTSNVIPAADLGDPRAISLSFANVTPAVSIDNETLGSFTGSVSGDFSSNFASVAEPWSAALLGAGLLGAGLVRRRRDA